MKQAEMERIVSETWNTLRTERNWQNLYRKYIDCIKKYEEKHLDDSLKPILSSSKLTLHSSIGRAEQDADKERDLMEIDLRFAGQSIATIKQEAEGVTLTAKENISDYFEKCPSFPQGKPLDSEEVKQFISFFEEDADESDVRYGTPKNRIIVELLKEFRKEQGADKVLLYIQPVLLNGMFFSMPVPFTIGNNGVEYTRTGRAGHMDILARRWRGVNGHRCIMSVIGSDDIVDYRLAGERALRYAVFMAALFRSGDDLGYDWWNFIREQETEDKDVPNKLHLDVVVATPDRNHENDSEILLTMDGGNCTFHYHTLCYDKEKLLDGTLTKFGGSYGIN